MKHVSNRPTRIALVGAGRIGMSHLEAVSQLESVRLEAVIDPRRAVAEAVAEQKRVRFFEDYRNPELAEMIDAVIICAPPHLHYDIAKRFLEQGKHVLCEKPLTISSPHAEELVHLAATNDLALMMASKFRYVDDIVKAKAILESGILGRVILYENTFCGKAMMKDRWNASREMAGGGVLIDNGTHSVDVARYLLGPIQEVQAQNGIFAQSLEVEDTARLQFRTRAGVIGMIDLSWSINKEGDNYISVFGSEGTLLIGWKGGSYKQDGNARWAHFGTGYDKIGALKKQIENFAGYLAGTERPLITPEDALASVKTIEAAYASTRQNNWLPVGTAA
ncbi:MAG TPA: Gfo/Idh/MocA family oxidoreductase [Polyangiaceae bacterium]|nr:Gfo/Idh/MocA family oxidoreductase [Polyangiaceae bacterium]